MLQVINECQINELAECGQELSGDPPWTRDGPAVPAQMCGFGECGFGKGGAAAPAGSGVSPLALVLPTEASPSTPKISQHLLVLSAAVVQSRRKPHLTVPKP